MLTVRPGASGTSSDSARCVSARVFSGSAFSWRELPWRLARRASSSCRWALSSGSTFSSAQVAGLACTGPR